MALIDYHYSPAPIAADLFKGLPVSDIYQVNWQNRSIMNDHGRYWVAPQSDQVIWVSDGIDRMAAAVMSRVQRYLYRGIARRSSKLLCDYLNGAMIPIPEGATIVNFGANIGEVAIALAAGAQVLAIEPDPNVVPALTANAQGHAIEVIPLAAWKEDDDLTLYIASEKADSSVIDVASSQTAVIPARRLDTLLSERGVGEVHLILGDAEGAEPEVLEGATETLKRTRYVSLRTSPERHGKSSADLCEAILKKAGFDILFNENETLIGRNGKLE